MPACRLKKITRIKDVNGNFVVGFSYGVLLQEGDRWAILDPENNNELASGMTTAFKDWLIDRGYLTILPG
jgi:hypothetical protein